MTLFHCRYNYTRKRRWQVRLGPLESVFHNDKGKIVLERETLVRGDVKGAPREWSQTPLRCGAVYCFRDQPESHLVVGHLRHETGAVNRMQQTS